jgi:hypothetical protein
VPAFTPPPLPSDDKRWKIVNGTMRKNGFARHALIETLHTVQSSFGYLDDDAIRFVAKLAASAAEPGLRRGDVLSLLQPEAAGQAHGDDLRGDGLLHQGRRQAGGRGRKAAGNCAGADFDQDGRSA